MRKARDSSRWDTGPAACGLGLGGAIVRNKANFHQGNKKGKCFARKKLW